MDELLENLLRSYMKTDERHHSGEGWIGDVVFTVELFGCSVIRAVTDAAIRSYGRDKIIEQLKVQIINQTMPTLKKIITRLMEVPPPMEPPCTREYVDKVLDLNVIATENILKNLREYIDWQHQLIFFMAKESAYQEGVNVGYASAKREEERQEDLLVKLREKVEEARMLSPRFVDGDEVY